MILFVAWPWLAAGRATCWTLDAMWFARAAGACLDDKRRRFGPLIGACTALADRLTDAQRLRLADRLRVADFASGQAIVQQVGMCDWL